MKPVLAVLREHGIQATPQRIAVAECVLASQTHPTADEVWARVRRTLPTVSRATVYNTLHLFARKGLLKPQVLREGIVVFDPCVERHHHFVDIETGKIYDIPWGAVKVSGHRSLQDFEVREHQVVLRGRRKKR